jgi:hypothetical protein
MTPRFAKALIGVRSTIQANETGLLTPDLLGEKSGSDSLAKTPGNAALYRRSCPEIGETIHTPAGDLTSCLSSCFRVRRRFALALGLSEVQRALTAQLAAGILAAVAESAAS